MLGDSKFWAAIGQPPLGGMVENCANLIFIPCQFKYVGNQSQILRGACDRQTMSV